MNDFNGELNKSLDDFMESYKMVDTEEIYSNGTEFVPIFRVKQWFEYNNQDKEIERLENIMKEARELTEMLYKNEANIFYKGTYKKQLDILDKDITKKSDYNYEKVEKEKDNGI